MGFIIQSKYLIYLCFLISFICELKEIVLKQDSKIFGFLDVNCERVILDFGTVF